MFIINGFNGTFMLLLAVFIGFLMGFWAIFHNRSEKTARIAVTLLYAAVFAFFWVYKYWISIDEAYSVITAENGEGAFSWWRELPLQLCNINLILIPIAVITKNKPLSAFAFFMAPFGAILAMLMPSAGFAGFSLFVPRVFGFYVTHMFVLIGSPMLALFGFYKPKFRDIPITLVSAFAITIVIFGINMLLRVTHTFDEANYFYCVEALNGTPLTWLWKLIPVPLLYMLPLFPVLAGYMALVCLPFELIGAKAESRFRLAEK
ncbi:MAG: YwaF family protein [Clostridia bacterium]|nr:YwaF family protein [Clostridia bacterium]